jgi:hypothetical protein
MACRPEAESKGARSHGVGRRWPGRIPTVPVMRCSGEGPGSKAVGWWTSFGVVGEEEAHRKNELGEVWSAVGERRWGQRLGVVVGSSRCGKVVHGGAVLGVWSSLSERDRSGLSRRLSDGEWGGEGGGGGKGRSTEGGGVGALYSPQRRWMRWQKWWAVRRWAARSRRGRPVVRTGWLTVGPTRFWFF